MISPYVFVTLGVVLAVRIILGALDDETERGEEDEDNKNQ
jgi:hypothetical protein